MSETEGTSVTPASFDPRAVAGADEVIVATYNVEALFDCEKDHEKQDHEYLPHGFYAWTEEKLARKLANIGRVIRTIADGRGPDILALNEVENRPIVLRLRDDALEDLGYKTVVHLDTECMYGLDNAILSRFDLVGEPRIHSVNDFRTEASRRARGILEATFDVHGIPLTLFVNHWPAGVGRTAAQRIDVARQLRQLVEARLAENPSAEIMVLGDFNATVEEEAFGKRGIAASTDQAAVVGPDRTATVFDTRAGVAKEDAATHFTRPFPYTGPDGEWNALDHIFVSQGLLDTEGLTWVQGSTQVVRAEFMLAEDGTPRTFFERGTKPRDQQLDRAGFSDHLPVVARLRRVARA
jgi:endonuclease/exonuclease/phosphatase family metal-dependent hydrolase